MYEYLNRTHGHIFSFSLPHIHTCEHTHSHTHTRARTHARMYIYVLIRQSTNDEGSNYFK